MKFTLGLGFGSVGLIFLVVLDGYNLIMLSKPFFYSALNEVWVSYHFRRFEWMVRMGWI